MSMSSEITSWRDEPNRPYSRAGLMHDRRLDVIRQHLFKFLVASWRQPGDARESVAEIVHTRSGTQVGSMTIDPEKHTAQFVSQWAIDECVEFARDCGETHAQHFSISLDDVKHALWVYPEGGDASMGMSEALVDQALRHCENKESQLTEMLDSTLRHQAVMIGSLVSERQEAHKTIAAMLKEGVEQMRLYKDLVEAKHQRELEVLRATKSEERKQLATDRFVGWADKAVEIAGTAMLGKVQQKLWTRWRVCSTKTTKPSSRSSSRLPPPARRPRQPRLRRWQTRKRTATDTVRTVLPPPAPRMAHTTDIRLPPQAGAFSIVSRLKPQPRKHPKERKPWLECRNGARSDAPAAVAGPPTHVITPSTEVARGVAAPGATPTRVIIIAAVGVAVVTRAGTAIEKAIAEPQKKAGRGVVAAASARQFRSPLVHFADWQA
jgi:hypothetical protein